MYRLIQPSQQNPLWGLKSIKTSKGQNLFNQISLCLGKYWPDLFSNACKIGFNKDLLVL